MTRARGRRRVAVAWLFAAMMVGCGGDDDAGRCVAGGTMRCELADGRAGVRLCGLDFRWSDDCLEVSDAGTIGVAPPEIPWLAAGAPPIAPPGFTPCPAGWREVPAVDADAPPTCDPYPAGGILDCPDGQAHFAGEPGCSPIGSPCPGSGEFADALPSDVPIVYVRPGAAGGDGTSPATPHGSLTDFSLAGLPTGAVIALSRGTHAGPVRLVRGVVLWGACASETILTASEPSETEGVVTLRNASGGIRDLTISDSPRAGIWMNGDGVEGSIAGVAVRRVEMVGVFTALGARAEVSALAVHDTEHRRSDGTLGVGLYLARGAEMDASRATFESNREVGVLVEDTGSELVLADAASRDTRERRGDGSLGWGLLVNLGGTATVTRALFELNREGGVRAQDATSTVALTDAVVRDTRTRMSDGIGGWGLVVIGGTAAVRRGRFDANRHVGIVADGPGSALMLADLLVRGTLARQSDETGGRALSVQAGVTLDVSRAVFDANRDISVYASGPGATVTLADIVVSDTLERQDDGTFGRGLHVQRGASASLTRASLRSNRSVGAFAGNEDTVLSLTDTVVRDTLERQSDGLLGRGLNVQLGAMAIVSRAVFETNREVAVYAGAASASVMASDVVIRDTQTRERDSAFGRGLDVEDTATATVTRALLEGNHEVGVFVTEPGSEAELTDVVVRDSLAPECSGATCPKFSFGRGAGSYASATLTMSRFVIARASTCGVHVALDGQVDLSDGEIRRCPIGVCLQVEPYDLDRLGASVRFVDNETNLEATSLPVPEPSVGIDGAS